MMTIGQANEMLDEVERQLGEEFYRRFHFWLDTTRDELREVTAVQIRDRGNGWLVATIPVSETTAQELLVAIQRLRLTK
jgi:MoxR-like ATPase